MRTDNALSQPRVMVIDDDEANHQILERIFRKAGIDPMMVMSGSAGVALAREKSPHLILLDVFMPGEDGFEILRNFKADPALQAIPVIIFTVLERDRSRETALALGAEDYITKPFDMRDIVQRIQKYLPGDWRS